MASPPVTEVVLTGFLKPELNGRYLLRSDMQVMGIPTWWQVNGQFFAYWVPGRCWSIAGADAQEAVMNGASLGWAFQRDSGPFGQTCHWLERAAEEVWNQTCVEPTTIPKAQPPPPPSPPPIALRAASVQAPLEDSAVRSNPDDLECAPFGALGKHLVLFDRNEESECRICGSGKMTRRHCSEPGHARQLERIRRDYVCYWQPLREPDGKLFFYDHVSCTWRKDAPRCAVVPRSCAEAQPEDANAGGDRKVLMQRVARVLEFADGSVRQRGVS